MKNREKYPLWVKIGLWGFAGRSSIVAFMWLGVVLAPAFISANWKFGVFFAAVPCLSWVAIRWVDKNDSW